MWKYNIWIVGASGAVWAEMITCLENLNIPVGELRLGWSSRSAWNNIPTPFGDIKVQEVNDNFFQSLDYVLLAAGGDISKKYADVAVAAWAVVIDNSSAFRYDDDIPLVIPQINGDDIGDEKIIANPNCTTAIAAVVLYPIYKKYGLQKILMSTYQATSWAWAPGMQELLYNTQKYFKNEEATVDQFSHNIAFNVIPHIDAFQENGYTKEEMKVTWETHKILGDTSIDISCTAVRIPTLRAHSEAIVLETKIPVDIDDIRKILQETPGVDLIDDTSKNMYPMPLNATGKNNVEVWRIRKNIVFWDKGLELFVSWDQLLRGAALNAVEILRTCIDNRK